MTWHERRTEVGLCKVKINPTKLLFTFSHFGITIKWNANSFELTRSWQALYLIVIACHSWNQTWGGVTKNKPRYIIPRNYEYIFCSGHTKKCWVCVLVYVLTCTRTLFEFVCNATWETGSGDRLGRQARETGSGDRPGRQARELGSVDRLGTTVLSACLA